jgi:predicted dehydrogenase
MNQDRRKFVTGSVAAGAATALPWHSWAAPVGAKKVRIGVVGGHFGAAFQWHEHPGCVVTAVSDLDPERRMLLKKTYRCDNAYDSLEKLVADKNVDAVAVFTGAPDHVRHTVTAMRAGKHVLAAVPAAMSLEEAEQLRDIVEKTGLTYSMAETSYWRPMAISARKMFREGAFGNLFYSEAEYHHAGGETLFFEGGKPSGKPTWRHGYPPMLYPTHSTSLLVGVTGERLTQVSCIGWGDNSPLLKNNRYANPFWNETAFFKTDRGNAFRCGIFWRGAHKGTERAQWYGDRMSLFMPHPNGTGPLMVKRDSTIEKDDAGFVLHANVLSPYDQPAWHKSDMVPEPLRHESGHGNSHTFITHDFVDALANRRRPAVDVYEALAYTVPGIVAHASALKGGEMMKIPQFDRKKS